MVPLPGRTIEDALTAPVRALSPPVPDALRTLRPESGTGLARGCSTTSRSISTVGTVEWTVSDSPILVSKALHSGSRGLPCLASSPRAMPTTLLSMPRGERGEGEKSASICLAGTDAGQ